jgi:hypothetical protein
MSLLKPSTVRSRSGSTSARMKLTASAGFCPPDISITFSAATRNSCREVFADVKSRWSSASEKSV